MKMIPSHVTETATISAFYVPPISVIAPVHSVAWHRVEQQNAEHCECAFLSSSLFRFLLRLFSHSARMIVGPANAEMAKRNQTELRQQIQGAVFQLYNFFFIHFIKWHKKGEQIFSRLKYSGHVPPLTSLFSNRVVEYMKWNISTFFFSLTFLSYAAM